MNVRLFDEVKSLKNHKAHFWENNEIGYETKIATNEVGKVSFYWNDGSFLVSYGYLAFIYYKRYKSSELQILERKNDEGRINFKGKR